MAHRGFLMGVLGALGAALVSLVVFLAAGAGPAGAAFPGENGRIAFVRGGDVWTMDPDGTGQSNLTNTPWDARERYEYSPTISPDGTEIAFVRGDPDDYSEDVWVMEADGSGQRRLVEDALVGSSGEPTWSPDGSEVAFLGYPEGKTSLGAYAVRADGSGLREVVPLDGRSYDHLAWSPDGSRFALTAWGSYNNGIYVASADASGPPERIVRYGEALQISWSPDGGKMAVADGGADFDDGDQYYDIYSVDPDGSGFTQLTETDEEGTYARDPAWSPDGGKIAFFYMGYDGVGPSGFYTMDPDGSDRKLVAAGEFTELDWGPAPASVPQEDTTDPTITRSRPSPGSEIGDRTPTIGATVRDETSELAKSDITLRVDGKAKAFSYDPETDRLSRATKKLSYGRHTVKVTAIDGASNAARERWSFRVVKRG